MKGLCEQAFLAASCIVALSWLAAAHAETQNADTARRLVGEWRLNADLSDKAPDRSQDGGQGTEGLQAGRARGWPRVPMCGFKRPRPGASPSLPR